jgi:hypothetical protein
MHFTATLALAQPAKVPKWAASDKTQPTTVEDDPRQNGNGKELNN